MALGHLPVFVGQCLPVVVPDQEVAAPLRRPCADPGDHVRQFAGDLDAKAHAGLVLHEPRCAIPDVRSLDLQHLCRSLPGQQRQIHGIDHPEVSVASDLGHLGCRMEVDALAILEGGGVALFD